MRGFRLGFLTLFCASGPSCLDPTEVDVTLTTDLRCPNDPPNGRPILNHTDIQVLEPAGSWQKVGETDACSGGRVGNIVFVPGQRKDEVHVRAVGRVPGHDDLKAMRILRFVNHQKLSLDVMLEAACVGVPCRDEETCVMGKCIDPPVVGGMDGGVEAGMPEDSGLVDVFVDTGVPPKDSGPDVTDAGFEAGMDAGSCPPPPSMLGTIDFHWGFNEGMGAGVTRDDSMTYQAPMTSGVGLVSSKPCGSALQYATTSTFDLLTTKWNPTPNMVVAFFLEYVSGSGLVLSRNRQMAGGWDFMLSNGALSFNFYFGSVPISLPPAVISSGTPHLIVGQYVSGVVGFYVDKMQIGKASVSMNLPVYTTDVTIGPMVQGSKITIDELYFGH